jgi:hypothetical protein
MLDGDALDPESRGFEWRWVIGGGHRLDLGEEDDSGEAL